jgi:hypothetical protein
MPIDPWFRRCVIAKLEALTFQDVLEKAQIIPNDELKTLFASLGFDQETATKQQFFDTYVLAHRENVGWLSPRVKKIGPGRMDKCEKLYFACKAATTPPSTADYKKVVTVITTPINPLNLGYSVVKNIDKFQDGNVTNGEILDIVIDSYNITPAQAFENIYNEIYRGLRLSKVDTLKDLESRLNQGRRK